MDETLNLSGARFKKDAASVKGFIGFMWTKGRFVFKKYIYVGCSKNIRFCVEPGLTAPGFPRILFIHQKFGFSNAGENGEEKEKAELLPNGKAKRPMTAAHEDKYFPARLNVPLYPEFSEEEANVMQTKLDIDEEKHDLKY